MNNLANLLCLISLSQLAGNLDAYVVRRDVVIQNQRCPDGNIDAVENKKGEWPVEVLSEPDLDGAATMEQSSSCSKITYEGQDADGRKVNCTAMMCPIKAEDTPAAVKGGSFKFFLALAVFCLGFYIGNKCCKCC